MRKIFSLFKKIIIFLIIYLSFDIILMFLLPIEIKNKIYDRKSHKIKSYYYHHDLRPNAYWQENWGYQNARIYTNNLGFKDERIQKVVFKENNILFIGDSFTEGVGVEYKNSFVGIIDNEINSKSDKYRILNAGVVSYSPVVILSKLNYLLNIKKYPISKVFVVLCNGDIHDDLYRYSGINKNYVVKHNDFLNVKILVEINNFLKSNTITYQFIKRITPLSNVFIDLKLKEKPDYENYDLNKVLSVLNNKPDQKYIIDKEEFNSWGLTGLKKSAKYIKNIKKILDVKNIELSLIYLEEPIFMLNSIDSSFYKKYWSNVADKNDIEFIFVEDFHKDKKNKFKIYRELFFIGDNHFNDAGNKVIAKEIIDKSSYLRNILY
tara:strand:- start:162 stop:1295 length:1134 start_codon:yes stop_codon:yes gene_type:complete